MKSFFIPKIGDNFDKKYCEVIEKIDTETKERYLYYQSKEKFKELFVNYTFVKSEFLPFSDKEKEMVLIIEILLFLLKV